MEKELNDIKIIVEELVSACEKKNLSTFCIFRQKDKGASAVAALTIGNPVDIIMAIMKAMNTEEQIKVLLKVAVENHEKLQAISSCDDTSRLFKDFSKN